MKESLNDRIRRFVEDSAKEKTEEYLSLLPRKDPVEPDPDTDKQYFSTSRSEYESALDAINTDTATASEYYDTGDLDAALDSLNHLMQQVSRSDSRKGPISILKRWISRFVTGAIRPELDRTRQSLEEITRCLNSINHKSRIFAGKQETLNSRIAVYGQKIVPVIDEKIRFSIERHSRYLKDRMDVYHEGLDRHQTEIANWLHNTSETFENMIRRVQDLETELRRGLALQHRKLEQALASVSPATANHPEPAEPQDIGSAEAAGGDYAYYLFEAGGRGPEHSIRKMQADYLEKFRNSEPVLDIGCGRGEFLELLRDTGIKAAGIDTNPDMVEICRNKGLDVVQGEGLAELQSRQPGSLGGIFAGQVLEHLPAVSVHRLLQAAFNVLRPGGVLVFETVNTASPYAMMNHFFRDPTHCQPLHPETYKFFTEIAGFENVHLAYRSPVRVPELPVIPALVEGCEPDPISDAVNGLGEALDKLVRFVYSPCDIAIFAKKPEDTL